METIEKAVNCFLNRQWFLKEVWFIFEQMVVQTGTDGSVGGGIG